MLPLKERQAARAERVAGAENDTGFDVSATMQASAEADVLAKDARDGLESAPLAAQEAREAEEAAPAKAKRAKAVPFPA
jgi:hypothetical protein